MKKLLLFTLSVWGLYSLGAAPAPGKWEIVPRVLVEGTEVPLEIRYVHTGDDLKPGEGFHMFLEKISVSTLFHCPMSEAFVIKPHQGELPKYDLKLDKVHGVGYREFTITFPEGLKKGESFAISHGNKKPDGSIVALITLFPMTNLGLPTYSVDAAGKRTD